jgi:hypothetical protein
MTISGEVEEAGRTSLSFSHFNTNLIITVLSRYQKQGFWSRGVENITSGVKEIQPE